MKPLLVGEAPNASDEVGPGRLAEYEDSFEFVNLLDHYPGSTHRRHTGLGSMFPIQQAAPKAIELHATRSIYQPFVLLGTRVALAFGLERDEYEWLRWFNRYERMIAVCPHPSGVNRWWNIEANRVDVDRFFKKIVAKELNR